MPASYFAESKGALWALERHFSCEMYIFQIDWCSWWTSIVYQHHQWKGLRDGGWAMSGIFLELAVRMAYSCRYVPYGVECEPDNFGLFSLGILLQRAFHRNRTGETLGANNHLKIAVPKSCDMVHWRPTALMILVRNSCNISFPPGCPVYIGCHKWWERDK